MRKLFANPTYAIYLAGFVFSAQLALTAYMNSSFLGQFVSVPTTGIIYSIAACIGIFAYAQIARVIRKIGLSIFLLATLVSVILLLFTLSQASTALQAIPLFILWILANNSVIIGFDVLLEHYSTDSSTGKTRGAYLTALNAAWVLAPLAAAQLIGSLSYSAVYLAGALIVLPVVGVIFFRFRHGTEPAQQSETRTLATLVQVIRNPRLRSVFAVNFLLQAFYVVMIIYVPLYLRTTLGYDWSDIGIMFTIMLLPFVLFEYLFGKIADRYNNERLIMGLGFILMTCVSAVLFYIDRGSIALWAALLFLTRTGAAAVEVTSESYLFKQITDAERSTISLFRTLAPVAYILIPAITSLAIAVGGQPAIWLVAAGLCGIGLFTAFRLK